MPYSIAFLGLINFFELRNEKKGRLVLIPDGRAGKKPEVDPGDKIDPHHVSFIVEKHFVLDDTRWAEARDLRIEVGDQTIVVREFQILEPSRIAISGMEAAFDPTKDKRKFVDHDFEAKSIKLKDAVDIDPNHARTIVTMPIRQGMLVTRRLAHTLTAILSVPDHQGDVIIEARPSAETVRLAANVEIVLVNMSTNLQGAGPEAKEEENHFRLYAQLDKSKNVKKLKSPTPEEIDAIGADEIDLGHPFVEMLRNLTEGEVPESQCTVTGCCDAWMCANKGDAKEASDGLLRRNRNDTPPTPPSPGPAAR